MAWSYIPLSWRIFFLGEVAILGTRFQAQVFREAATFPKRRVPITDDEMFHSDRNVAFSCFMESLCLSDRCFVNAFPSKPPFACDRP
jgi:hypothetical protein